MKLILYGILLMFIALLVPPALPYAPAVTVFLVGYAGGMCLFIVGFGRFMSLPGFR